MIRVTTRTARKPQGCDQCRRSIRPGERYLSHVASPGHEDLGNTSWWRSSECCNCAELNGRSLDPQPVKEAV